MFINVICPPEELVNLRGLSFLFVTMASIILPLHRENGKMGVANARNQKTNDQTVRLLTT